MGAALEILCGQVTAPDTTLTALTMNAGNSLTVRNAPISSKPKLLTAWVDVQLRGLLRLRSPNLHDNVQGLRFGTIASEVQPLLDPMFMQPLIPQDTLVAELSGSATAGDIESAAMLVHYDDLPGIASRLFTASDIKGRMKRLVTVENTLAFGTAGGYSGEEALNAEFDLLKANTDYALLGYNVSPIAGQTVGECLCVRYRGEATGNLGIGGPGTDSDRWLTNRWFVYLSERTGLPCIPVFNSASRAAILLDGHQDENGVDVLVTTIFAEL